MSRYVIAAAQYPIDRLADWEAYSTKLRSWVAKASAGHARLAVFPEYGAMELAALDSATMGDLAGSMQGVAALIPRVDALHEELAREHQIYILAASAPVRREDGRYVNRARLFAPNGEVGFQDKLIMTRFEREHWGVSGGDQLTVFDTALGRIGVCICYDCEFPLIARTLVEAGAEILLIPSCTDTLHGYHRVRIGTMARALEGQCIAVQAPTVGEATWSPAVDMNRGRAGIFGPPDVGFPENGIIAEGGLDTPEWIFGEIDTSHVAEARAKGSALNTAHWIEQPGLSGISQAAIVRTLSV